MRMKRQGDFRVDSGEEIIIEYCWKCKTPYALEMSLYKAAKRNEDITFYCSNGHPAHYPAGATETDKLRRERDSLKQQTARLHDRIREEQEAAAAAQRSANAYKGQATKLRNRAAAGVCPCCNRQFQNLHRHMKSQHPNFGPDEDAQLKVIEGGKKTA